MSSTHKAISHQVEKFVQEFYDGSVRILDICGITRDTILQIKENVEAFHSSLRKRKGNSSIETSVYEYNFFTTKKMKKNITKLITYLKQIESKFGASAVLNEDQELVYVIRVIREVIVMNMSIFHSPLSFLCSSKSKSTKWLRVAKLMNKRVTSCEDKLESFNKMRCVEVTLSSLLREGSNVYKMQTAHERLETLENVIERMENGLENVFRRLVKTRVCLLNIVTIS
uniref:Uncharacterized protein LOC101515429 n=1 Tax=Cicer arietinum TaxID=3827 RepID=A0A3Q7YC34_CICAR|nr:uncharacterized protein LOC101515429 [Cicer arietinum]